MAIQINSSLDLTLGIPVNGAYLRMEYLVDIFGKHINYKVYSYLNRDSYIQESTGEGLVSPKLDITNFAQTGTIMYDKDVDGPDILQIVHDYVFSYITEDETTIEYLRDPSTGEYIIDPSTGEIETREVVIREKFVLPENVFIVDIDSSIA